MDKILVTGAGGQLGTELSLALRKIYGVDAVLATDIKESIPIDGPYQKLDVLDKSSIEKLIKEEKITQIYHLAAVLSARAEANPTQAWDINMKSLLTILQLSVELNINRVFWPSSIAVFGPNSPMENTPQHTIMDPSTVYGISKLAGERWMEYYHLKYGLDTRSIRYPGIISYKTMPGGGTTDYAIDIFHKIRQSGSYECFLSKDTALPMMYIDDAIRATTELMQAEKSRISIRSSYNLGALSFTPAQLFNHIKEVLSDISISYEPDFRQQIADSWPNSVDDSAAQKDFGWAPQVNIEKLVEIMLENIR